MDLSDFLAELNIRIGDTDDFTFTPEEKTAALTEAINDSYVLGDTWNTTLTYASGTYQYALPSGVTVITDIYVKPDNSLDLPEKIPSNLWEVVGGNLQFTNYAGNVIPVNYSLYLKGRIKYTTADTIAEISVQEYVLTLAQLRLYKIMLNKKSMRFLKNDTTVSEIVTIKRDLEQDVTRYRQRFTRQFEVA